LGDPRSYTFSNFVYDLILSNAKKQTAMHAPGGHPQCQGLPWIVGSKYSSTDVERLATLSHTLKKHPRLIVQTPAGPSGLLAKERRYVFTYDPNASGLEQEVSLGLKFRLESYQSDDLFGIFSMNEPEEYLRAYLEEAMSRAGTHEDLLRFGARFSIRKGVALGWIDRIEDAITGQLREAAEDPRCVSDPNGTLAKLREVLRPRGIP
jgi:hypothetical protein